VIRIIDRAVGSLSRSGSVSKWIPRAVDGAELVVGDLADEGGAPAEGADAGGGVAGAAARRLDRGAHQGVEPLGLLGVDQAHRALDQVFADEEVLLGPGDHVDNGIADAEHVEFGFGHSLLDPDGGSRRRQDYRGAPPERNGAYWTVLAL
jgi:hypothetical protein